MVISFQQIVPKPYGIIGPQDLRVSKFSNQVDRQSTFDSLTCVVTIPFSKKTSNSNRPTKWTLPNEGRSPKANKHTANCGNQGESAQCESRLRRRHIEPKGSWTDFSVINRFRWQWELVAFCFEVLYGFFYSIRSVLFQSLDG